MVVHGYWQSISKYTGTFPNIERPFSFTSIIYVCITVHITCAYVVVIWNSYIWRVEKSKPWSGYIWNGLKLSPSVNVRDPSAQPTTKLIWVAHKK